jgi:hypothetical protein
VLLGTANVPFEVNVVVIKIGRTGIIAFDALDAADVPLALTALT